MKTLIIGILLFAAACTKSDVNPKYADITGTWTFSGKVFSGDLDIVKIGNDYYTAKGSGFRINGKNYSSVLSNIKISVSGTMINAIEVDSPDGYVQFYDTTADANFSQITSTNQTYGESCLSTACPQKRNAETIVLSRK